MSTPYSDVIERAIEKITDSDILKYDNSERDEIFERYLVSAIVSFQRLSKTSLSDRDNVLKQFNNDLDDELIEILATGIVYQWVKPKVNNTENLKNVLNTKDFSQFSPANLLSELQKLRDSLYKDFKRMCIDYSYDTADIVNVKTQVV